MSELGVYYAKIDKATMKGAEKGLREVGIMLRNVIVADLSKAGRGVAYGNHRASAPGDPPATDTGSYKNSWNFQVNPGRRGGELLVGTGDERGPWLEFGTRKMAPRPHLRPAMEENHQKIGRILAKHVEAHQRVAAGSVKEIVLPVVRAGMG